MEYSVVPKYTQEDGKAVFKGFSVFRCPGPVYLGLCEDAKKAGELIRADMKEQSELGEIPKLVNDTNFAPEPEVPDDAPNSGVRP